MAETTKELVERLNQIMVERKKLEINIYELDREHDEIVFKLWERLPNLKGDPNIQPKKKVRK